MTHAMHLDYLFTALKILAKTFLSMNELELHELSIYYIIFYIINDSIMKKLYIMFFLSVFF
jgi:hypothetical protein